MKLKGKISGEWYDVNEDEEEGEEESEGEVEADGTIAMFYSPINEGSLFPGGWELFTELWHHSNFSYLVET